MVADAAPHAQQLQAATVVPATVPGEASQSMPAMSAVLARCLHSTDLAERATSRALLRVFCNASAAGQQALLAEASQGSGACCSPVAEQLIAECCGAWCTLGGPALRKPADAH